MLHHGCTTCAHILTLVVPGCSMMFIDFSEFTNNTETVIREVCSFVGADPSLYKHTPLPPGMKVLSLHCWLRRPALMQLSEILTNYTGLL